MNPKILYRLFLSLCIGVPATLLAAGSPPNSEGLKSIVIRISTDIHYRNSMGIKNPELLQEFYERVQYNIQWFSSQADTMNRNKLKQLVANPNKYMLQEGLFHDGFIINPKKLPGFQDTLKAEILFTDAALSFLNNIAYPTTVMVKYNGWKYSPDCISFTSLLQFALTTGNFEKAVSDAEPGTAQYQKIKAVYQYLYNLSVSSQFHEIKVSGRSVINTNQNLVDKLRQLGYLGMNDTARFQLTEALNILQSAHNLPVQATISAACLQVLNETIKEKLAELRWNIRWYRWLGCMQNRSYVIVNLASNRLAYVECDEELLSSKIVVGKISTPSPTLTSSIRSVIYYPYWNVPFSIATKEMLPKLKRNPAYLDALNIEVLKGGKAYGSSTQVNWHNYSTHNFPFNFRQTPGCHNSLGLLKFDFESPFSVYLHDTNSKGVFLSRKRFFSHGCIRVEKPYDLALSLGVPAEKINMDSCFTGMKPEIINLQRSMPIFVIYATVDLINGELTWFEDAYRKRID